MESPANWSGPRSTRTTTSVVTLSALFALEAYAETRSGRSDEFGNSARNSSQVGRLTA